MDINSVVDTFSDWGDDLVDLLPNLLLALLIVLVFFGVGRLLRRWVRAIGLKISDNKAVSNLFAVIAYVTTLLIGFAVALRVMNLDGAATSILAGAGIAGVALGFALQDVVSNFVSGIVLAIQRPMKIGDLVETHEVFGIVKRINLRSTEIETLQGQLVHIPNKDILLNPVTDYSHQGYRRIDMEIGVSYDDDLERAKKVALKAITTVDGLKDNRPIDMYYTDFGDSSINFVVRFWINFKKQTDFLEAQSQAVIAIKSAFDREGITIPFPVSTFELKPEQANMLLGKKK